MPFPGTKGCPRSALPGEGGGWVWPLEPLSPHGAAGAPPPPGTQMRFIQQTKPPPPPGHTGTWTRASPWEGGGDRRSRQVLSASLPSFISHNQVVVPDCPPCASQPPLATCLCSPTLPLPAQSTFSRRWGEVPHQLPLPPRSGSSEQPAGEREPSVPAEWAGLNPEALLPCPLPLQGTHL